MDEFHFGNVKVEKANATRRYNFFAAISKTLRIIEFCLALILLSWILTRIPFALQISAEFFRKIFSFVGSPLFVFALSNAIIAALLAQSGGLSGGQHSAADNAYNDGAGIYGQFLKNRSTITNHAKPPSEADPPPHGAEAVEYQDKEVVSETAVDRTVQDLEACMDEDLDAGADSDLRSYRRSLSEKWKGEAAGKIQRRKFRRSETEKRRENLYPQDKLSNEEFQRTIEAFIAKQMRFLREEESSAIVVQNPS